MEYTQQRRRAMNKAVRDLYPHIVFYESPNGIPIMECNELPKDAKRIDFAEELLSKVNEHCVRINDVGMRIPDYHKALPVFIRSMEIVGKNSANVRHYYRANYVSTTEGSQQKAAEYIAEGKLYAVI